MYSPDWQYLSLQILESDQWQIGTVGSGLNIQTYLTILHTCTHDHSLYQGAHHQRLLPYISYIIQKITKT